MTLYKGQHITITGAAGTVAAEVLHVETPAGLPAISGAPEVDRVRDILAEWQINELALLGHLHNGREVMFIAMRDDCGIWRDLRGQVLTIETGEHP